MKVLLVSVYDPNTISLAPYVLKAYADQHRLPGVEIEVLEGSLFDQSVTEMAKAIAAQEAEVIGFSAFIWNIREILGILPQVRGLKIVGGPHVTGIEEELLRKYPSIDLVVTGEGEEPFVQLLEHLIRKQPFSAIPGVTTREFQNAPGEGLPELDAIPRFYPEIMQKKPRMKWVPIETSRGCPFACGYCVWGKGRHMRYHSMERVKADLDTIMDGPSVEEIYFCDSSILCDRDRAKEILTHILARHRKAAVRFEFRPEMLDDELIDLVARLPNNDFNFGIQSTNPAALRQMDRPFDPKRFEEVYQSVLARMAHADITVDLIYGLPGDNLSGYKQSLEYVVSLEKVRRIITNPLLALPGADFYRRRAELGIQLRDDGSYRVEATATFSRSDMSLARKHSFQVALIYWNARLRDAIRKLARKRERPAVDVIADFLDGLPIRLTDGEYPDMVPAGKSGFALRNRVVRNGIGCYDRIVKGFGEFSGHAWNAELADYRDHFSTHYYKLKRFCENA